MKLLGIDLKKLKTKQVDYMSSKIMLIVANDILGLDSFILKQKSINYIDEYIKNNELSSEKKELLSNVKMNIKRG